MPRLVPGARGKASGVKPVSCQAKLEQSRELPDTVTHLN
jgi:hypothetical protein